MKKILQIIFILFFSIIVARTFSQSLQISDESGTLANGAVVYVYGDTTTGTIIVKDLDVKNISGSTVTIKSKKIETSLIPGTSVTMCFAGQCFLSGTFISTTSSNLASNLTDTSFSGDYKPKGHLGESIVTFVFFDVSNPNDSAWVLVHYNGVASGITEQVVAATQISNAYPNPAKNQTMFNYSFPKNTSKSKFVLSDLLGSIVRQIEIYDQEGTLIVNTSDLKDGIYFYNFYVNDKMVQTKKLIVKH